MAFTGVEQDGGIEYTTDTELSLGVLLKNKVRKFLSSLKELF